MRLPRLFRVFPGVLALSLFPLACGPSEPESRIKLAATDATPVASPIPAPTPIPDLSPLSGPRKGLASWYRANSVNDSTNGVGWCGKPYNNNTRGFAPPFIKMSPTLATWSSDPEQWKKDTKKWCGLEARVTNPLTGHSELLIIVDAFSPAWVRTEYAVDILLGPFKDLAGDPLGDKNIVVHDMEWELTGRRFDTW